jgi:hypothetical protein
VTSSFALNPVFVWWGGEPAPEYELGAGHLVFLEDQEERADRDPEACEGWGIPVCRRASNSSIG